jgi:hypothetical protein
MAREIHRSKAQTTIIMLLIVIIIFGGIIAFLLSIARQVTQEEYLNMYVHNSLLAVLRSDTGQTGSCKVTSDLLMCAFTENQVCPGSAYTCLELAETIVPAYFNEFDLIRENYRYLFIIEPDSPGWVPLGPDGQPLSIKVGDETLEEARIEKIVATEKIIRAGRVLDARLIIARRAT